MLAGLITDWYAFGRQNRKQKAARWSADQTSRAEERRNEKTEKTKDENSQSFSVSAFQHFGRREQSALSARADGIPDELVRAFPFRSLLWKWRVRQLAAQGRSHEAYLQTDAVFATAVARLKLPPHEVFFGYSYASLEVLEAEKKRGVLMVLDQIDPGAMEFQLVAEEMARFPKLAGPPPEFPAAYYERNQREWALADRIVVNSEWSRKAMVKQGVAPEKLFVMPLCYEANAEKLKAESRDLQPSTFNPQPSTTPLRALFLSQVNVRKGIHYLMQAAKLLANEPVRFDVVGSIGILPGAVASAPRNMTFHGPVSRGGAAEWYRKADLFVLPTISDGFAITQLEAMSHGVPVITTPCCGEVVSNGVDGFIVPSRDAEALAKTFLRYLSEPSLLKEQQKAALVKAKQFTLERLAENLCSLEAELEDRSTESKAKSRK
jgi:glycosyltransferase involved in cell wall biosynthesis